MESFDFISCSHVFRENKCQADSASKEGLQLDTGVWKIKERLDDVVSQFYHRPFIEGAVVWDCFLWHMCSVVYLHFTDDRFFILMWLLADRTFCLHILICWRLHTEHIWLLYWYSFLISDFGGCTCPLGWGMIIELIGECWTFVYKYAMHIYKM